MPSEAHGTEVTFRIPDTESLGRLAEMKHDFSLILKYKTADEWATMKDKPFRAYYMGLKEIPNDKGDLILCGMFVSRHECFISGQKVLVDAVRQLPTHTPLEIIYRGKSVNKTTEGATMKFDITILA